MKSKLQAIRKHKFQSAVAAFLALLGTLALIGGQYPLAVIDYALVMWIGWTIFEDKRERIADE